MKLFMNIIASILAFSAVAALPVPYAGWDMNAIGEGRKVFDITGNGRDMTLGDGVTLYEDADFGKVLRWEGTRGSWGAFQNIALEEDRTISIWFYRDELDADLDTANNNKIPYIINNWSEMLINFSKGTPGFNLTLAGANFYNVVIPGRSQWHRMTVVFKKTGSADDPTGAVSGELRSYLDGVLYKTWPVVTTKSCGRSGTTVLGNNTANSADADPRPYKGLFSKIRLYSVALADEDVRETYLDELDSFGNRLVGSWSLGECAAGGSGNTVYVPEGEVLSPLEKGQSAQIVFDPVMGRNVTEFPNCSNGSYAWLNLPVETRSFSFGMYLNFPTNMIYLSTVGSLDDPSKTNTMPNVYYFGAYSRLCIDGSYRNSNYTGGHFFDAGSLDNSGDQGFYAPLVTVQKGRWGHLGMTFEISYDEEQAKYAMTPRIYVDGTCVQTGDTQCAAALSDVIAANTKFYLGTGSTSYPRSFCGRMADFTVYNSLLNDEAMAELARGMPAVDAGGDFTVACGATGYLNGSVSRHGTMGNGKAAATTLRWRLVSSPAGGESASLQMADSAAAKIVLPAAGEYVFRLTASSSLLKLSVSDDVTVTCVAPKTDNAGPTVSVSGPASAGVLVPVEFSAVAADPDSAPGTLAVRWKVVSGPGAASFNPVSGQKTEAKFFAAGTYRIAAVAFDGQSETTSDHFEVKVEAGESIDLGSGLIAYWPFDMTLKEKTKGVAYTGIDRSASSFEKGVDGYGVRLRNAFYPNVNTQMTLQETVADSDSQMPVERYRAFSAWIYHDPADTNNSKCATIVSVPYTLGLWYNCENGVNGFSLYQQILKGPIGNGNVDEYAMPSVNPEGRWTHVYALFDRTTGYQKNTSELWVDGVRMTNRTKHGMGGGRVQANEYIMIGGHRKNGDGHNGHYKDEAGNYLSRTFPGIIDEVRMYNRRLTEAEIKYLAANPVVDVDHAPAATLESGKAASISRRDLALVAHVGDVGGDPSALSGRWEVVAGDAGAVVFGDVSSAETTFTAKKAGVYSVVYVVSDGRHVTYSEPMEITVERAGMVLKIK